MSRPLLQGPIIVLGLFVSGATQLPQAVAQEPEIIRLNFTQTAVIEGNGSADPSVQLKLTFDSPKRAGSFDLSHVLTVEFATEDRTARGGRCGTSADYEPVSSQVSFAGEVSRTFGIRLCSDGLSEGNEQFAVRFTAINPAAVIQPSPGIVTITDDEPLPTLSITRTIQVDEPNSGQALAVIGVSLTGPPAEHLVTVDFATAPGTAAAGSGCPVRGVENIDYVTRTGTLSFVDNFGPTNPFTDPNPGTKTRQYIRVPVCSDNRLQEPNETFFVNLTRPVNARLTAIVGGPVVNSVGTVTIVD